MRPLLVLILGVVFTTVSLSSAAPIEDTAFTAGPKLSGVKASGGAGGEGLGASGTAYQSPTSAGGMSFTDGTSSVGAMPAEQGLKSLTSENLLHATTANAFPDADSYQAPGNVRTAGGADMNSATTRRADAARAGPDAVVNLPGPATAKFSPTEAGLGLLSLVGFGAAFCLAFRRRA